MRKKAQEGVRGKFIPRCLGDPPQGGRMGKGWEQQPPDRREGGLLLAPLGGAGGLQAASKLRASKKANGWEPPGGRTGRGAHGKPHRPAGRWGLPGAPLGGAGENFSRQGICAPELRGRRGLTSSICVIIACDNIHRISPLFVLLVKEPRVICFSGCKHDRCHKGCKEPRGICYRFFRLLPTCKRGT